MSSPINSYNSNTYDKVHQAHAQQQQTAKAEPTQQNPSVQIPPPIDDTIQKHGGHGGHGGHEKISAIETSEKSFRSHFRHMKSPTDIINQQRMMRELELKEQLEKAALRKKKMVEESNKLQKKNKKDEDTNKKKKKNPRHPSNNSDEMS